MSYAVTGAIGTLGRRTIAVRPLVTGFKADAELDTIVSTIASLHDRDVLRVPCSPSAVENDRAIENLIRVMLDEHREQLRRYLAPYMDAPEPTDWTSLTEQDRWYVAWVLAP